MLLLLLLLLLMLMTMTTMMIMTTTMMMARTRVGEVEDRSAAEDCDDVDADDATTESRWREERVRVEALTAACGVCAGAPAQRRSPWLAWMSAEPNTSKQQIMFGIPNSERCNTVVRKDGVGFSKGGRQRCSTLATWFSVDPSSSDRGVV